MATFVGIGRSTIWRHVSNGLIPPPTKLAGRTLFATSKVARAIALQSLLAERDAPAPRHPARRRAA